MKIVIVGAGTAGWIAASTFKRRHPEMEVVILHDPTIKTMGGVGETLVWNMPSFFHDILGLTGCREWMKRSQATFKTGVKYHNLGRLGFEYGSSYSPDLSAEWLYNDNKRYEDVKHFLFDKRLFTDKGTLLQIWLKLKNEGKYSDILKDFPKGLSEMHYFSDNETSIISKDGEWLTNPLLGHSFHYNAEVVGSVIGDLVARPLGVKEVHGNVKHVVNGPQGIDHLILEDGTTVDGDFFIDCSGFKKILAKTLPFKWKSSDEYSNNSSLVRPMFYDGTKDRGRYVHNRTFFHGHKSGWSFSVPLLHRTGNGYTFNTRITPDIDQIADEFNAFLGPKKSDEPDLRLIQWESGYNETFMVGNCMTMGLALGFIDPYASNNLAATTQILTQIFRSDCFGQYMRKEKDLDTLRNDLNSFSKKIWDHIAVRVQYIFRCTERDDSEYWRTLKQVGIESNLREHIKDYVADTDRMSKYGTTSILHAYLLASDRIGLELPSPDINLDPETERRFVEYFIHNMTVNEQKAKNSMPIEEFYKHFYSDDFPNKNI